MLSDYVFGIEKLTDTIADTDRLWREQFAQMNERLSAAGVKTYPYNPNYKGYLASNDAGILIYYTARRHGKLVGHSTIYLFNSMHDQTLMAREDTIFVTAEHRKGVGRLLTKFILQDLKSRGVTRGIVQVITDLRVEKLWNRMGFKTTGVTMQIDF